MSLSCVIFEATHSSCPTHQTYQNRALTMLCLSRRSFGSLLLNCATVAAFVLFLGLTRSASADEAAAETPKTEPAKADPAPTPAPATTSASAPAAAPTASAPKPKYP